MDMVTPHSAEPSKDDAADGDFSSAERSN